MSDVCEQSGPESSSAGASTCARCGSPQKERLFLQIGSDSICECCLLDQRVEQHRSGLDRAGVYSRFVEALTETLDLREKETGLHSRRTACHTLVLARRVIDDPEQLHQIYWGALLHDIGKIGIPDHILLKGEGLTPAEWEVMRSHVDLGYGIVRQLPDMDVAADLVRGHEERFDGSGYPRGLRGQDIPFGARIFAIIDTLDAMTSDRSYRRGLPFDTAKAEILRMSGSQFDPLAVDLFLAEEAVLREMVALKCHDTFPK